MSQKNRIVDYLCGEGAATSSWLSVTFEMVRLTVFDTVTLKDVHGQFTAEVE
jgi:hypothetical protein